METACRNRSHVWLISFIYSGTSSGTEIPKPLSFPSIQVVGKGEPKKVKIWWFSYKICGQGSFFTYSWTKFSDTRTHSITISADYMNFFLEIVVCVNLHVIRYRWGAPAMVCGVPLESWDNARKTNTLGSTRRGIYQTKYINHNEGNAYVKRIREIWAKKFMVSFLCCQYIYLREVSTYVYVYWYTCISPQTILPRVSLNCVTFSGSTYFGK